MSRATASGIGFAVLAKVLYCFNVIRLFRVYAEPMGRFNPSAGWLFVLSYLGIGGPDGSHQAIDSYGL